MHRTKNFKWNTANTGGPLDMKNEGKDRDNPRVTCGNLAILLTELIKTTGVE